MREERGTDRQKERERERERAGAKSKTKLTILDPAVSHNYANKNVA